MPEAIAYLPFDRILLKTKNISDERLAVHETIESIPPYGSKAPSK
jgi:hypothetical protein